MLVLRKQVDIRSSPFSTKTTEPGQHVPILMKSICTSGHKAIDIIHILAYAKFMPYKEESATLQRERERDAEEGRRWRENNGVRHEGCREDDEGKDGDGRFVLQACFSHPTRLPAGHYFTGTANKKFTIFLRFKITM